MDCSIDRGVDCGDSTDKSLTGMGCGVEASLFGGIGEFTPADLGVLDVEFERP